MTMTINDLYIELRRQFRAADISMGELEARELAAFVSGADKRKTADWGYRYLHADTVHTAQDKAARRLAPEPGRPFLDCLSVVQMEAYRSACRRRAEEMAGLAVRVWDLPAAGQTPDDLALSAG